MARPATLDEYRAIAAQSKGKPTRMKRIAGVLRAVPTEHDEQRALFEWAQIHSRVEPALKLLFAIPNAGAGAQRGQAGKMKAEGVKPGVPDLMLPVARRSEGPFTHGLFIELKALDGRLSEEQWAWICALQDAGYAASDAYGWQQARDMILGYLAGTWP
jgi:VRR-NUC domain-containing protein